MFPLLAAASDDKLADALTLLIVGMAVVFGSLAVLLAVVAFINRLLREDPRKVDPRKSAATSPVDSSNDTQLVAVLAAAATVALGRSVQVTDVQPVSENTRP